MRRLLTISLLLYSIVGFSQQAVIHGEPSRTIDSLTARLKLDLHDTDRVETLNRLAWGFKYTNPDTAIILSSEALAKAEAIKWQLGIAHSFSQLGTFNRLTGKYTEALDYFFKALKLNKELHSFPNPRVSRAGKSGIAGILGNIGIVHMEQGEYPKALEYYFKALKMNEELEVSPDLSTAMAGRKGVSRMLGNIGNIYGAQGDYTKALEYALRSLKTSKELGLKNSIAIDLGNIGNIYNVQGDNLKALEYYLRALKMNEESSRKTGIAINLGNIGLIYKRQKDYTKALEYYFKALNMAEELGDKMSTARHLTNIGSLYLQIREFDKGEKNLQKAITLAREIRAKEYLRKQYKALSDLYATTSRPALAFEAYKLHIIYRDSMDNEENTRAQTRTEMKYEYEKAELVKEQEEKEVERIKAEATSRRDNLQYSVILITILVLFGGVLMMGFINVSERMAEGVIFFSFLIFFEFILVLADPYIEGWSGGAPGIKLLFNAGIAALIFPLHAFFESKLKGKF